MIGPPRPYVGRLVLALSLVATGLVLIFTIGMSRDDEGQAAVPVPERRPQPHAAAPKQAVAAPFDRPRASDQAELDSWAGRASERTGVPARVLAAYGRAEMWMRTERPECHLSWGTLAGVGRVESQHGHLDGIEIKDDGMPTRRIVGVPLDGSPGVREIRDTDNGRLDGDRKWDRAVGPMQFLPSTWERFGGRAIRDGARPNPQNMDDAALAAARYLCWNGRDLATPAGWWDAVLSYNASTHYGQQVFSGATAYAKATTRR